MNVYIYKNILNCGMKIIGWENGSICLEYIYGTKVWCLNGKRHRTNGPSVEFTNGDRFWYLNGKLHRADGPAREHTNGYKSWWLNGKQYTEEKFNTIQAMEKK